MKRDVNKTFKFKYSGKSISVEEWVNKTLDGADYERGVMEEALEGSNNNKRAISKLLQVLVNKDTLTLEEVYYIVYPYNSVYNGEIED